MKTKIIGLWQWEGQMETATPVPSDSSVANLSKTHTEYRQDAGEIKSPGWFRDETTAEMPQINEEKGRRHLRNENTFVKPHWQKITRLSHYGGERERALLVDVFGYCVMGVFMFD